MGEQTVHLSQILQHYNGRCENLELVMDLLYESKSEGRQMKNGELVAVLNGLKIDMSSVVVQNGSASYSEAVQNGNTVRSSVLNGGIRSRMRLRSTNGASPVLAANGVPPTSPANLMAQNGALANIQSPSGSTGAVRRWEPNPPLAMAQQQPNHQRLAPTNSNPIDAPAPPPIGENQVVAVNGGQASDDDEPLPAGWERRTGERRRIF